MRYTGKKCVKNVKPSACKKVTKNIILSFLYLKAFLIFSNPLSKLIFVFLLSLSVSLNSSSRSIRLSAPRKAIMKNGRAGLNHEITLESENIPPMNGPITNPTPNAAPIRPKFFALSLSVGLKSAIAEFATAMLPPVKPSKIRLKKRSHSWFVIIPSAKSK